MIFKTITNSVDESRQTLALFNKDWNTYKRNWQNANGIGGKIGSLFTPANAITKSDIDAIKAYNAQIDACTTSQTAFNRTMLNASPTAQNLVASYNGGKVSAQGMATAQDMAKTSTIGLTIAQTALNAAIGIGVGLLINLVVQGVNKLIHANEEAIESAKKLREEYEQFKSTNASNVSTLKGLEEEFNELSKGVSQYGDNISLTTEQYERYKEIIQQIVGMSPSLTEGYSTENGYIADKNGLLERAIELQEQEYRNELRKITNLDNLKTSMSGYIAEYKDAFNGGLVTDDMSATATREFTDLQNAIYEAFNINNRSDFSSEDMIRQIMASIGIEDIESEMAEYYNEYGYFQSQDFWKEYADTIAKNIEIITGSLSADDVGLGDTVFDQNIEKVDSAAQAYLDMKDAISMANESIQIDLGYIAEYADGYSNLSTEQQKFVNEFLKGYDISDIMSKSNNPFDQGWKFDEDKMASVKSQITKFVKALSQDETTKEALADLYAVPIDEQSISEYVEQFRNALEVIKSYCEENEIEIPIAISDSEQTVNDLEAQCQRAVDYAKDRFDGYDPTAFFEENSINTQEEVDKWLEIAQAANSAADAEKKYVQGSASSNETDISFDLENFSSNISEITSAYSTLSSAIEEYNTNGSYSLDTMTKLLNLKPEYLALLITENGQLALNEQGLRAIIEAQLQQAEAEIYATGITKLKALSDQQAGTASTEAASKMSDSIADIDAQTASYNANTLAVAANKAVKNGAAKANVEAIVKETEDQVKAIQNAVKGLSFDVSGVAGGFTKASSSASKTLENIQSEWKEYLEKYLDLYDAELDAGLTDFNTYLNKSRALLDEYYHDGKISAKDYWDYLGDLYDKQLTIYDKVISAVTRRIDKEIDGIEDLIASIEKQNDALESQLDNYDSILSVVDSVYEAEIDRIKAQQDAIQENIDALQEENDERELTLKLEQAKYDLYKAQTQRTKKVFNGTEFVYETDRDAVRDAQENLADLTLEQTINGLEAEKDALSSVIEELEYYQSLWADISNAYDEGINKQLAISLWGADYEQLILSNRLSDINSFKNDYISIQEKINDNQGLIDSYNEKIEYYEALKQQWSDITDAYEQAQEDQYAAMILGSEWESDVLSGRLETLKNFRDEYISIQQSIATAAREAQKAASGSTGGAAPIEDSASTTHYIEDSASTTHYAVVDSKTGDIIRTASSSSKANAYIKEGVLLGVYDEGELKVEVKKYASGTTNAKRGINLVGENGTETYIDNDGNAALVTKPTLIPMEGGETVKNAMETKSLLDMNNLVSIDIDEFRQKLMNYMPSYSGMVQIPNMQMPNFDYMTTRNETTPVVQNINLTLPNVTNNSGYERIKKELKQMQIDAYQLAHRR